MALHGGPASLTSRPALGKVLLSEYGSVASAGAASTAFTAALTAIGSSGTVINPTGSALDLSSVTIPNGVVIEDLGSQRMIFSNVGVGKSVQAGGGHLLIRDARATQATRAHIEPNGYPSGTKTKLDWMFDPYEDDGTNYRIHNRFTFDDESLPTAGYAFDGVKSTGNGFGIWPRWHLGFSDAGSTAVPMTLYYADFSDTSPWRTPFKGAWRTGKAVTSGDYVTASNKLYQSGTTGTTGATVPSHAAGSVSDGTVSWTFVRDWAAASSHIKPVVLFGERDDLPKLGSALEGYRAQFSRGQLIWNGTKIGFLDSTGALAWTIYNPVGTDDLYLESADGARRMRFDFTGQFIQVTGLSRLLATTVATDLDTTPSIKGIECLTVSNSGATTITAFDDGVANQTFFVEATNGNTTLTHNASIILTGAANITMATGRVIQFKANSAGSVARMVG